MIKYVPLAIFMFFFFACKKEKESDTQSPPPFSKLIANFNMTKQCNPSMWQEALHPADSLIFFVNRSAWVIGSDSTPVKSYLWNFGDNTTSTVENPSHKYHTNGTYPVRLITFLNNIPSDTITRNVQVIVGQKKIRSTMTYTQSVDLDETPIKGALVLMTSFNSYSGPFSYSLLKVDSLLNQVWMKPVAGSTIRLSSLKMINASEYILSGNYSSGNTDVFSISKIDSSGTLKWVKYINDIQGKNNYTTPTSDGGFLTIGNSALTGNYSVIVVKFDNTGNELWRKVFNGTQLLRDADNIIETSNGYVFASVIRGFNNHEIVVTKLDFSGNIIQQNSTFTTDASSIYSAGVSYTANTYLVYTQNATNVYLFANDLTFLKKRSVTQSSINATAGRNGLFYLAEGSFQYAHVYQVNTNADANWEAGINNQINISCSSYTSGPTRYCRKVLCSGNDEIIALSYGQDDPNGFTSSSVYLEKFSLNGILR